MVRMRCISRCQFKGDIVRVGDTVDMDEETMNSEPLAKSAFVPEDVRAEESARTPAKPVVAGLTREQAILKLNSMKVNVPGGTSDKALAELFLASVDAKAQHKAK